MIFSIEWTRREFQFWAQRIGEGHGYTVSFLPIGSEDAQVGVPIQMGIFTAVKTCRGIEKSLDRTRKIAIVIL